MMWRKNGFIESFSARLRDELLDGEIFYTLKEAKIVIESWRRHHNTIQPHSSPLSSEACAVSDRWDGPRI